jgi:hypothetical protein
MESPLYTDPVTREAPTRPLVLTLCGHSADQSYLHTLEERARKLKASNGFCCLVCERVSPAAVRNFALETMLRLTDVEGPVRIEPVQSIDRLKPLCELPEYAELAKKLETALTTLRDRPFAEYQKRCKFLFEWVLAILNGTVPINSCYLFEKITHIFPAPSNVLDFIRFGNGRYKTEFLKSHRLRIKVILRLYDPVSTYQANGWWAYHFTSSKKLLWKACTEDEFEAAPASEKAISVLYELVD